MAGQQLLVLNPRPLSNLSLLDEPTIFKICEYLSLRDVFQFGELDMNYQRIIGEQIISKRMLVISEISKDYPVRDVFRHYGEFVTALSINESDIRYKKKDYAEEIFRLIKKRCVTSRLKTVAISFDKLTQNKGINAMFFLDVFAELESLTVMIKKSYAKDFKERYQALEKLLGKVLMNCTKLRSLKLVRLWSYSDFLMLPELRNLHSLWLDQCDIPYNDWLKFVKAGVRPLKSLKITNAMFQITNKVDHGEFLKLIVEAFPKLEIFCYTWYCRVFVNHNYEALGQLRNLKEVDIEDGSYSNLISSLAASNTVKRLSLNFTGIVDRSSSINLLQNLRFVEFYRPEMKYIHKYLRFCQLPNVTECMLTFDEYKNVYDILQEIIACPLINITVLRVLGKKLPSKVYDSLVSARSIYQISLPPGLKKPLHLHAYFRPLSNYKPDIITIHNHNHNCDRRNCHN